MPARPVSPSPRRFDTSGLTVLLVAALVLFGLTASAPPGRVHATGAVGVVVRHSDGRLLYAYIPLTGDHLTGAEVLMRAGFALNLQASSSLGAAVCTIDGEGCDAPKEDCFCKSYGDPAYYWHYYLRRPTGAWANASLGAGNRILHDGDVDGWSWTAGDSGLPTVTLDQIAALVQAPATVAPPPLLPTPNATPGVAPTPAASMRSPVPSPSPVPTGAAATMAPELTATVPTVTTATAAPSPGAMLPDAPASASPAPAPTTVPSSSPLASPIPAEGQPRAVIVGPNGTITPVQIAPPPAGPNGGRTFAVFAAVALGMLVLLAVAPRGARRRGHGGGGKR